MLIPNTPSALGARSRSDLSNLARLALCLILQGTTLPPLAHAMPVSSGKVVLLKGHADRIAADGRQFGLAEGVAVYEGDTIVTAAAGGVKILLRDLSEISVGEQSKFKIDEYVKNEPGLFTLLYGHLRSKVSKSINGDTKMIIRTPSSAMGVRGTDFDTVYNPKTKMTSLVTYEGAVAMATRPDAALAPVSSAEVLAVFRDEAKTVIVAPGQFAGASPMQPQPTIPVKISPLQLESLKATTSLRREAPANPILATVMAGQGHQISPVPPGLNPKAVVEASSALSRQVLQSTGDLSLKGVATPESVAPPEGIFDPQRGLVAPPAGGFVDLKTGLYVAPPPGSAYDSINGVYLPPRGVGTFKPESGAYVAPPGLTLDPQRGLVATSTVSTASNSAMPGMHTDGFGKGMVAAPLPTGVSMSDYVNKNGFIQAPMTVIMAGDPGKGFSGGLYGVQPPRGGLQYPQYDGFAPAYPVYDPFLCPPYCDPRFQPGTYAGQPFAHPTTSLHVHVVVP